MVIPASTDLKHNAIQKKYVINPVPIIKLINKTVTVINMIPYLLFQLDVIWLATLTLITVCT